MNVSQMCITSIWRVAVQLGFYKLPDESYLVSRILFRWILVDWFPEQPVGLRLPKGFKIPHDAEFGFDFEKQQLLKSVDAAWHARSPDDWGPHPMFGKMTLSDGECDLGRELLQVSQSMWIEGASPFGQRHFSEHRVRFPSRRAILHARQHPRF